MKKKEWLKTGGTIGIVASLALLFVAGVDADKSPEFTMFSILLWFMAFLMLELGN